MNCLHCVEIYKTDKTHKVREATEWHHIIFRNKTQGGTDDPINLAPLCWKCHNAIHHGSDSKLKAEVLATCYEQIKGNLSKCWDGLGKTDPRFIPAIINRLKSDGY